MKLYPAWWRARYGSEFEALLEQMNPDVRDFLNIVGSACLMRVKQFDPTVLALTCGLIGMAIAAGWYAGAQRLYASTLTIAIQGEQQQPSRDPLGVATRAFSDQRLLALVQRLQPYDAHHHFSDVDAVQRFRHEMAVRFTPATGPARTERYVGAGEPFVLQEQGNLQLSFVHADPRTANAAVGMLATLVIDENFREAMAAGRTRFWVAGPPKHDRTGLSFLLVVGLGLGGGWCAAIVVAVMRRRVAH